MYSVVFHHLIVEVTSTGIKSVLIKIHLCKAKNKVELYGYLSDQCEQEILHIFLK